MTIRPLTSEDLGEKGEHRFAELCSDLTVNRVTRDRAGFDYIVDFRLPADGKNLDSRPAPISARVQVKTHWADRDEIRLRLSAAEQLIKHPGPSFICALAVDADEDLSFARMHLIHCQGEIVERVLKRLRQAEADGKMPNTIWLTVKPSDFGPALAVRPSELKRGLKEACTADALAYLTAKDRELKTVGFGPQSKQIKVSFTGRTDDVIDAFLGLRPLDVTDVEESQTRFGITLPLNTLSPGPAQMKIDPPAERWDVSVRVGSQRYRFKGKAVRPPALIPAALGRQKILIRAGLMQIALTFKEATFKVSFARDQQVEVDAVRKIADWRDVYAILAAMTEDGASVSLQPRQKSEPFRIFAHNPNADTGPEWRKLARLTAASARVFEVAGRPNAKASLQTLWAAGDDLTTLAALIDAPDTVTGLSFTTTTDIALPRDKPINMMLGQAFEVGDRVIAMGASLVATAEEADDEITWAAPSLKVVGVRQVRSKTEFETFLASLPRQPFTVITGLYQTPNPSIFSTAAAET